jgi:DHA1 family tetracycline resistance protein-like MFS transporter
VNGRRQGVLFALLVVFFDMMAASIVVPVLPPLVLQLMGGNAAGAAGAVGVFGTIFSAMQLIFGPLQGALSDRFGRRPVLVVSCVGLAVSQAVAGLAPSIAVLLAGRVLAGISAANVSTATAYLADILPPEERAAGFGRIGVAFGAGLVLGPVAGGLLGGMGLRAPFWAASGIALFNAGWALFVLRESLPPERRAPFRFARANPIGAVRFLRANARLTRLAAASTLSLVAQQALISIFILSASIRFGWGPRILGLAMGGVGVCYAVVGGALVQPAISRIGSTATLSVGLGFGVLGFAALAVAPNGLAYVMTIPIISLWGLSGPVVQGAMSRTVGADEQGRLQGANTSLAGLAGVIGPALFGGSFAWALRTHAPPGVPFGIAAVLVLVSVPLAIRAVRE